MQYNKHNTSLLMTMRSDIIYKVILYTLLLNSDIIVGQSYSKKLVTSVLPKTSSVSEIDVLALFYCATLCVSAIFAVAWCLFVCLSVHPSITLVHCIHTSLSAR